MNFKKFQNILSNNILAAQIVLIVVAVGAIFLFERFFDKDPFAVDLENRAALFIDFDNMQRMFTGEIVDGMTVLDALNASVVAGQINLRYYVDEENNTKVAEINNHNTDGKTQFTFYINSKKIDASELNKTHIQPGDKITIRLE